MKNTFTVSIMSDIPSFPLFNSLYNECQQNPNKYVFNDKIRLLISTLPEENIRIAENIYYIIHHYYALETYNKCKDWGKTLELLSPKLSNKVKNTYIYLVEYGGKTYKNGISVMYASDDLLPAYLKLMISAYISHIL